MKKLLAFLLSITMLLSLNACSSEDDGEKSDKKNKKEKTPVVDEITFEEMTVVDNDYCTIKLTGVDPDDDWGFGINIFVENKTDDRNLMFSVDDAIVNGVEFDPFFATEVAPGKKDNDTISFMDEELTEIIGVFTDIEMNFRVYDSDNWEEDDLVDVTTHVYPYGEDKVVQFSRESLSSDIVLLDNEYVTMLVTGFEEDHIWGYTANVYLVNKTDVAVMFSVEDASINGYMIDPFFAQSVSAGCCAFGEMTWSEESLAEDDISIKDIETIEMTVRAYNDEEWQDDDFANETVTIEP